MSHSDAGRRFLPRDRPSLALVSLAIPSILAYALLAARGDLRTAVVPYLAIHAALVGVMLLAWRAARPGSGRVTTTVLVTAVLFRLAAGWGGPALSDDVYRYVWDGRVQLAGVHPYLHAPDDPELQDLRDANWPRINHPDVPTIYPPLMQMAFAAVAAVSPGPTGFQVVAGLLDVGVILALLAFLRSSRLPRDRLVLYAWNPLVIMETAGSGHFEPLAVGLVLLAVLALETAAPRRAAAALGLAIQAKLFPIVLVPGAIRRMRPVALAILVAATLLPALPYALTGPTIGGGLGAYAERWERNASVYYVLRETGEAIDTAAVLKPGVAELRERFGPGALPYDWLYRHVWPRELSKAVVAVLAATWILWLSFRRGLAPSTEVLWTLGGVLLLVPTVHPWYLLWIAPLAAALRSPGWLFWILIVPLAYLDRSGDVPGWVRVAQYAPTIALLALDGRRALAGTARRTDGSLP